MIKLSKQTGNSNKKDYMLIAGPCSAESYSQLLNTALELKKYNSVDYFRVGVWKPRTKPGGFQGAGNIALEWLKEIKEIAALKIAVEVATPKHIDDCLKAGVDMVWIGARTGVNPFSVDDIAAALRGVDLPVVVKNPLNPDVALWEGVIERIRNAGIKKLLAVHRGFYTYEKSIYRNQPLWEIPIELKRRMPDLPLLCDPSHIAGNKDLILQICQHAIDLDMDGFMVESHYKPEEALTDARQQITPKALSELWNMLEFKSQFVEKPLQMQRIEMMRDEIDSIDHHILQLLAKRMEVVKDIGLLKQKQKITILQIMRWNNIFENRLAFGKKLGIESGFLKKLLQALHQESIRIQRDLEKKTKNKNKQ